MEIDIDATYMTLSSKLQAVDGMNVVDLDVEIIKEESDVQYQATVFKHNVDHYEHMYKSAMESGCTHEAIKDPVLNFIFKESKKFGNITEACPLKIGHYQLRGFKIESDDMPHQLPAGSYRFEFSAYIKKDGQLHDIYTDKYYFTKTS